MLLQYTYYALTIHMLWSYNTHTMLLQYTCYALTIHMLWSYNTHTMLLHSVVLRLCIVCPGTAAHITGAHTLLVLSRCIWSRCIWSRCIWSRCMSVLHVKCYLYNKVNEARSFCKCVYNRVYIIYADRIIGAARIRRGTYKARHV